MTPERGLTLSSRKQVLDNIAARISCLEGKRQHLVDELAKMDTQIRDEIAKYNTLCNEDLPISKLPVELLSSIFLLGQKTAGTKRRHSFTVTVSHVCRRWHTTALSTPLLWNTIRLLKPTPGLPKLEAYLIRSNTCLLDITVKTSNSNIHAIMNMLIHHSKRWHRFSLRGDNDVSSVLFEYLHEASVPLLEYLYIDIGDPSHPPERSTAFEHHPKMFIRGTPALRALHLSGVALTVFRPILTNITTLELASPFGLSTNFTEITRFLDGLYSLITLSICYFELLPDDLSNVTNPVTLPFLRSLHFGHLWQSPTSLLSLLALPSLELLAFEQLERFDPVLLPSVRRLYIDSCYEFEERDFVNLIGSCPSVTHLSIFASGSEIYSLLTPSQTKNIPWSSLQSIRISLLDGGIPELRTMLTKRVSCEHPVKELYLTKSDWNKLRRQKILGWFQELLAVGECEDIEPWVMILGYDPEKVFT